VLACTLQPAATSVSLIEVSGVGLLYTYWVETDHVIYRHVAISIPFDHLGQKLAFGSVSNLDFREMSKKTNLPRLNVPCLAAHERFALLS
jgi:hypothetical protein